MFWHSKQPKKRSKARRPKFHSQWAASLLRVEHLEDRHMLSGVVNVVTTGAPGSLAFVGDSQDDSIMLQADPTVPGQFLITGTGANPTLFTLNGAAGTNSTLTVNNITGNITVNLGDGDATFDFEGPTGGGTSTAPGNVTITNNFGNDINIFNNVLVTGDLDVTKTNGATGASTLSLTNTTVVGDTTVVNAAGGGTAGGNSTTLISGSMLEGGGPLGNALSLTNANGLATFQATGTSTFGAGNKGVANVTINNQSTGASVTTFAGTATVFGTLDITNGDSRPGQLELVSFSGTTVLGSTTITNGNSATKVISTNSNLGMQFAGLVAPAPVTITNGVGFDSLAVSGSTMPWGLGVSNDNAGAGNWGSSTTITTSSIGNRIGGPAVPGFPNDALRIAGDAGPDVVSISTTTIGGTLDLSALRSGNNSVTVDSDTMGALNVTTTGTGNNFVKIAGGSIQSSLIVNFANNGVNELDLRNGTTQINGSTAPVVPSLLTGTITVNGGPGTSTFRFDTGLTPLPLQNFTSIFSP